MIKKIFQFIVLFSIILLSFSVRKKNYSEIPIPGQSVDEYSYSWVGLSLLKTGVPVGISGLQGNKFSYPKYVNVDRFFQTTATGDPLTINYPWLDHPPLLGIITGAYAHFAGAQVFEDTTALFIRRPIIVIGTISVALAMLFAYLNYGFISSVLVGLIYGTTPLVVISSRMIQAENAVIPCLLSCLICLSLYFKTKKDYWLIITSIIAGLATLFKLSGFVCHLFVLFSLLAYYKKINKHFWQDFCYFLIISLPLTFLFVIYGAAYDIQTFKNIVLSNYNRFYGIGPSLILDLIRNQRLTQHKFLPEVWIILSWITFFVWTFKKHKKIVDQLPIFALGSYLIVYVFFGSQPYGWYAFPFWPFLFIILARIISLSFTKNKYFFISFFISLCIFGENVSRLVALDHFQKYATFWRLGTSIFIFLLITSEILKIKTKYIRRIILFLFWLILFYTNYLYLSRINIDFWWQNIS